MWYVGWNKASSLHFRRFINTKMVLHIHLHPHGQNLMQAAFGCCHSKLPIACPDPHNLHCISVLLCYHLA